MLQQLRKREQLLQAKSRAAQAHTGEIRVATRSLLLTKTIRSREKGKMGNRRGEETAAAVTSRSEWRLQFPPSLATCRSLC